MANQLKCSNCNAPMSTVTDWICKYCGTRSIQPNVVSLPAQQTQTIPQPKPPVARQLVTQLSNVFAIFMIVKLILFGMLLLFCAGVVLMIPSSAVKKLKSSSTRPSLSDKCRQRITAYVETHSALPDEDAAKEVLSDLRDRWRHRLRYKRDDIDRFTIISDGPDRDEDTADDVREQFVISELSEGDVGPPQDIEQAISYLTSPSVKRRELAVGWLATAKPIAGERYRVVSALESCINSVRLWPQVRKTLSVWATSEETPILAKAISELPNPLPMEIAEGLLAGFVRNQDTAGVVFMLNDPNPQIAGLAKVACRRLKISSDLILKQCLADLSNPQRCGIAMQHLSDLTVLPSEQFATIAESVCDALSRSRGFRPPAAIDILEKTQLTSDCLRQFVDYASSPFLRSDQRRRAFDLLMKLDDKRTAELMVNRLKSDDAAVEFLTFYGPAVEDSVWPLLSELDYWGCRRSCRLLMKVGTKRSIPYLEGVAKEAKGSTAQRLKEEVSNAISAINLANRTAPPSPK